MPSGMQHPAMNNPPPSQMANFGAFNPMASFNNLPSGNVLAGVGIGVDQNKKPPPQANNNKSAAESSSTINNDQQNDQKGMFLSTCS